MQGLRTRLVLGIAAAASIAIGCGGPAPPSTSIRVPGSGQPPGTGQPGTSGRPASLVAQPPATPSTSWTVVAGGGADVYRYEPSTVIVPVNQPVSIRFVDGDVLDHSWTVFDADGATVLASLSVAKEGDESTGTFTFPTPGTYAFWCTVPGHRAFGEVGTLFVAP